ncbi:hypothetical protein ScPMuIL_016821 [Solemya velum]
MFDYFSTVVLVLILFIQETVDGYKYTPTQCQDGYDRCVEKEVYPEHTCDFKRLKCLILYCDELAKSSSRSSRLPKYSVKLIGCAIK